MAITETARGYRDTETGEVVLTATPSEAVGEEAPTIAELNAARDELNAARIPPDSTLFTMLNEIEGIVLKAGRCAWSEEILLAVITNWMMRYT